jgi:hypothetical protein
MLLMERARRRSRKYHLVGEQVLREFVRYVNYDSKKYSKDGNPRDNRILYSGGFWCSTIYPFKQTQSNMYIKSHPVIQAAILDGIALEATSHHVLNTAKMAFREEINLQ